MLENIHDKFFRKIFSENENTRSFLQNYLPQNILNLLDLNHLHIQKDSFIDENLKNSYSDLLFKSKLKNHNSWIYILFEHKSFPNKYIPLQLLRYMLAIWNKDITNHNQPSPIIPILLYHGDTNWKKITLENLIPMPKKLKHFLPNFDFLFFDLSQIPDNQLKGNLLLKATLLTLKYILTDKLNEKLPLLFTFLNALSSQRKLDYIRLFLYYITGGAPKANKDILLRTIHENLKKEELMSVIAEEWIKEGIERGLKEGLKKGQLQAKLEDAKNFLNLGVDLSIVLKATGLTKKDLQNAGILPKD